MFKIQKYFDIRILKFEFSLIQESNATLLALTAKDVKLDSYE